MREGARSCRVIYAVITAAERGSVGLAALDENRANQREEREKPFFDFSSNVGPLRVHML